MIKDIKNILGLTILESLVATAIVGIGFVAILQMTNFSVQSIDSSGERTKANYLVSMIAEDVIGHKNTIYGLSSKAEGLVYESDGTISKTTETEDPSDPTSTIINTTTVQKFTDHLVDQDFIAGTSAAGPCVAGGAVTEETDVYGTQEVDAPRNKQKKWQAILGGNRYLKCRGENDIKKMKVYKICRWAGVCDHINNDVTDNGMYIGRIQVNLNDGRKRKYLYFQADYKIKK
mgnify:FL=1